MKNILITGGAGFIGSNLSLALLKKGYNITILDNLSNQIHGDNPEQTSPLYSSIKDKVKFIKGDVTSLDDWKKAIDGQHVIVHFAAETGTGQSMYKIDHYTKVIIKDQPTLDPLLKKNIEISNRQMYDLMYFLFTLTDSTFLKDQRFSGRQSNHDSFHK